MNIDIEKYFKKMKPQKKNDEYQSQF